MYVEGIIGYVAICKQGWEALKRKYIECLHNQGWTLVSPYVEMSRKQDGGSNGNISNYTTITRLGASVTHFEAIYYPFWVLPLLTPPPKSPVSSAKLAKRQLAITRSCLFFFHSFISQVSALNFIAISTKPARISRNSSGVMHLLFWF